MTTTLSRGQARVAFRQLCRSVGGQQNQPARRFVHAHGVLIRRSAERGFTACPRSSIAAAIQMGYDIRPKEDDPAVKRSREFKPIQQPQGRQFCSLSFAARHRPTYGVDGEGNVEGAATPNPAFAIPQFEPPTSPQGSGQTRLRPRQGFAVKSGCQKKFTCRQWEKSSGRNGTKLRSATRSQAGRGRSGENFTPAPTSQDPA